MRLQIIENIDKDKIIQTDAYWNRSETPLTYRVSIKLEEDTIILKREYFFVGYHTGESADVFYFNDDRRYENIYLNYATFITRNFKEDYLKEKESELINKFFEKLNYTLKKIKQDKDEKALYFDEKIKQYKEYSNNELFLKIKRNKKINKINERT